jgi:hypothetical protein
MSDLATANALERDPLLRQGDNHRGQPGGGYGAHGDHCRPGIPIIDNRIAQKGTEGFISAVVLRT